MTKENTLWSFIKFSPLVFKETHWEKSGEIVCGLKGLSFHELHFILVPGPPSAVNVYAFAKYILVTWKAPVEPNGVITKYRVGSAQYEGSQPSDDLQVSWQEVGPGVFRKLLENQTPERNYVVEIQAETSKGWGDKVRKTTRTVKYARKYFLNTLVNIALTWTLALRTFHRF